MKQAIFWYGLLILGYTGLAMSVLIAICTVK